MSHRLFCVFAYMSGFRVHLHTHINSLFWELNLPPGSPVQLIPSPPILGSSLIKHRLSLVQLERPDKLGPAFVQWLERPHSPSCLPSLRTGRGLLISGRLAPHMHRAHPRDPEMLLSHMTAFELLSRLPLTPLFSICREPHLFYLSIKGSTSEMN